MDVNRNKFCFVLISFYMGICYIPELAINYFLKDNLGINPSMLTSVLSFSRIPGIIKPILGLVTDFFPLFGYRRKYYIFIAGILISISFINLAFFTDTILKAKINLSLYNAGNSFISILGQAIIVELIQENKKNSTFIVSVDYIIGNIGYLISCFLQGLLIEKFSVKFVFIVSAFLPIVIFLCGLILKETKISENKDIENKKSSNILLFELYFYLSQKKIIITLFTFFILLSMPVYSDTLFYFYSEKLEFSPNDIGKINFYGTIINICLITIYERYNWQNYVKLFFVVLKLLVIFVCYIHNWVVKQNYIQYNISPYLIICCADTIRYQLNELINLPLNEISAKLSPKNLEGTVNSLFMSVINFGTMLSSIFGSWIVNYYKITQTNFDNLCKLIDVCSLFSFIPIIYIIILPDQYISIKEEQNEKIKEN